MYSFFGFCSPSGTQSQVVPRRYAIGEDEHSPQDSPKRQVDIVRLKPQPQSDGRAVVANFAVTRSVEEELTQFCLDVRVRAISSILSHAELTRSVEGLHSYTFDASRVKYTTPLVTMLKSVVDRHMGTAAGPTGVDGCSSDASSNPTRFAQQEYSGTPSIASACKTLTQILVTHKSTAPASSSGSRLLTQNESALPLQSLLIAVDIFLLAVIESGTTESGVQFELHKLLRAVVAQLATVTSSHPALSIVLRVGGQICAKACRLGVNIAEYASNISVSAAATPTVLDDLVQLVQVTSETVQAVQLLLQQSEAIMSNTEGAEEIIAGAFGGYYCTILCWQLCSLAKQVISKPPATTIIPAGSNTLALYGRLHNAMLAVSPTVEALHYELQRMAQYKADGELFHIDRRYAQLLNGVATPAVTSTISPHIAVMCSFKLRFLLCGIEGLCQRTVAADAGAAVREVEQQYQLQWAISVGEVLISVVNKARNGQGTQLLYLAPYLAQLLLRLLVASERSALDGAGQWVSWELARGMSEFTVQMRRLQRAISNAQARGSGYSAVSNHQGNAALSQGSMRSTYTISSKPAKHGAHLDSGRRSTDRSDRPLAALRGIGAASAKSTHAVGQSTAQNGSSAHHVAPSSSTTPAAATASDQHASTPKAGTYNVGDKVDGQCTLPNGTQRWYPGVITAVKHSSDQRIQSVTIKFSDGEEKVFVEMNEIRIPKRRKPRGAGGRGSGTEDEESGYDSSHFVPHLAADSRDSGDELGWSFASSARTGAGTGAAGAVGQQSAAVDASKILNAAQYRMQVQTRRNGASPPLPSTSPVARGHNHSAREQRPSITMSVDSQEGSHLDDATGGRLEESQVESVEVEAQNVDFSDDGGDEADSEDADSKEEDRVFEIPSVFEGGHRTMPSASNSNSASGRHFKEALVPRIQFEDLDVMSTGSGMAQSYSNMSLSGALLSDSHVRMSINNGLNSFRTNNGDGTSRSNKAGIVSQMTSHRSYLDQSMLSISGDDHGASFPHIHLPHIALGSHRHAPDPGYPDEPTTGGNTRLLTWRGADESVHTASTSVIGGKMPNCAPGSAYQNAQEKVLRKTAAQAAGASARGVYAVELPSPLDDSGAVEVPEGYKQYFGLGVGITDAEVQLLLTTNTAICAVLLQVATTAPVMETPSATTIRPALRSYLHSAACSAGDHASPLVSSNAGSGLLVGAAAAGASPAPAEATNMMFTVREFIEVLPVDAATSSPAVTFNGPRSFQEQIGLSLATESGVQQSSPAAHPDPSSLHASLPEQLVRACANLGESPLRLCKLLHGAYFQHNCLVRHISDQLEGGRRLAEKIGEGGFGTVFRVDCNCPTGVGAVQISTCVCCYRTHQNRNPSTATANSTLECKCWRSACSAASMVASTGGGEQTCRSFAVKRVPRERSMHDPSRLYDICAEVAALEKLRARSAIGVCGLQDFGVVGSEYWIVLELGRQNVEEYRCAMVSSSPQRIMHEQGRPLDMAQVATCLCLFVDALLALQSVHDADIAHFDIKASNFMLRENSYESTLPLPLADMRTSHERNQPSGYVFLADFGEAVTDISHPACAAQVQARCRGTLFTQSPEMLCISQGGGTGFGSVVGSGRASSTNLPSLEGVVSPKSYKNGRMVFSLPDQRSDIWSAGCLLVEILTGMPLFAEKPWPELYATLCMERFNALQVLVPAVLNVALQAVPPAVRQAITELVLKILQQSPDDRPALTTIIADTNRLLNAHFGANLNYSTTVKPHAAPQNFIIRHRDIVASDVDKISIPNADWCTLRVGENLRLQLGGAEVGQPAQSNVDAAQLLKPLSRLSTTIETTAFAPFSQLCARTIPSSAIQVCVVCGQTAVHLQQAEQKVVPVQVSENANTSTIVATLRNAVNEIERLQRASTTSSSSLEVVITVGSCTPSANEKNDSRTAAGCAHTSRLEVSVAMALGCLLHNPAAEGGLAQVAQLWQTLPALLSPLCDRDLVHLLVHAASVA